MCQSLILIQTVVLKIMLIFYNMTKNIIKLSPTIQIMGTKQQKCQNLTSVEAFQYVGLFIIPNHHKQLINQSFRTINFQIYSQQQILPPLELKKTPSPSFHNNWSLTNSSISAEGIRKDYNQNLEQNGKTTNIKLKIEILTLHNSSSEQRSRINNCIRESFSKIRRSEEAQEHKILSINELVLLSVKYKGHLIRSMLRQAILFNYQQKHQTKMIINEPTFYKEELNGEIQYLFLEKLIQVLYFIQLEGQIAQQNESIQQTKTQEKLSQSSSKIKIGKKKKREKLQIYLNWTNLNEQTLRQKIQFVIDRFNIPMT